MFGSCVLEKRVGDVWFMHFGEEGREYFNFYVFDSIFRRRRK